MFRNASQELTWVTAGGICQGVSGIGVVGEAMTIVEIDQGEYSVRVTP